MDNAVAEIRQLRANVKSERRKLSKEDRQELTTNRNMYNEHVEKIVSDTRDENRRAKEAERKVIREALNDLVYTR